MATQKLARDLTRGNVVTSLLSFAWPLMLGNLLQILYNIVDMMIIGKHVGSAGLAAVSNAGQLLSLMTMIGMSLTAAGQVLIAQSFGRQDLESTKNMIGTMFTFLGILAVIMTFISITFTDFFIRALQVPEESVAQAKSYLLVCYSGLVFIFGYNIVSGILRGLGDSMRPLIFIAISAILNLLFDLLFIVKLEMGVVGAALGTILGQSFSFIVSIWYLYKHRGSFYFDFKRSSFKIHKSSLKALLKLGIPMALLHSSVLFSKLFVSSFINSYGLVISAINGVGLKITQCGMIVTQALSTAGTSMIGQSYGANKTDRISRVVYTILITGLLFTSFLSLMILLFPIEIFSLFDNSEAVLSTVHIYIPIAVFSFNGFALRAPMMALIHGIGNPKLSFMLSILDGLAGRIGIALLLGLVFNLGITGFWLGDICASYMPFFLGAVYFWGGYWKRKRPLECS